MKTAIVDRNVLIVANDAARIRAGKNPVADHAHIDQACRSAAFKRLSALMQSETTIIDAHEELRANYRTTLRIGYGEATRWEAYEPQGIALAFLQHLDRYAYHDQARKVRRVALDKTEDGSYGVFPSSDERLQSFDLDDRIFVALAIAAPEHPPILNAVDSDYRNHQEALLAHGVVVEELCPHCLTPR